MDIESSPDDFNERETNYKLPSNASHLNRMRAGLKTDSNIDY
jgi:hypothetical protein